MVREGELPPLENTSIVSLIFKKLPLSDLKSCRQVCQLWAMESSRIMCPSTKVTIRDGVADRNLADFVDLISREESMWMELPLSTFYSLDGGHANNQIFWRLCGAQIRRLSLCQVSFQSVDVFLQAIVESTPSLEHLHFNHVSFVDKAMATKRVEGISNTSVRTLSCAGGTSLTLERRGVHILQHFPSLQTLHIHSGFGNYGGGDELFESLAKIRRDNPASLNLKKVDIHFKSLYEFRSMLTALVDTGLNLECIVLRWWFPPLRLQRPGDLGEDEASEQLIEAHAASLQELHIIANTPDLPEEEFQRNIHQRFTSFSPPPQISWNSTLPEY